MDNRNQSLELLSDKNMTKEEEFSVFFVFAVSFCIYLLPLELITYLTGYSSILTDALIFLFSITMASALSFKAKRGLLRKKAEKSD